LNDFMGIIVANRIISGIVTFNIRIHNERKSI